MKAIAIVQARMNSTRLPGKVMMEVKGKPLLKYLLERIVRSFDEVIVATPDAEIEEYAADYVAGYRWYGPENDVAGRFAWVLDDFREADTFVRICADSPLLDPALVDAALALYEPPYFKLVSPVGCVEVCNTAAFLGALPAMDAAQREHVLTWFAFVEKEYEVGRGRQRLVVDTQDDFDRVKSVIEKMDRPHTEYGWRECLSLL